MIAPIGQTSFAIPTFEKGRLRYRAPSMADFEAYAAFRGSERSKGVGGPHGRGASFDSLSEIIGHWHLRGYGRWIVADIETDRALGVVGLMYPEDWPEPEIAWSVFADAEGKGIAFEAAQFARSYAYEVLGWDSVVSCTALGNTRSEALAKRMGARFESLYQHPELGPLNVWRHLGPQALAEAS